MVEFALQLSGGFGHGHNGRNVGGDGVLGYLRRILVVTGFAVALTSCADWIGEVAFSA